MNSNPKLSYAIAIILGGSCVGLARAEESTDIDIDAIQEVKVTAQRRTENIQNVPITIQVLTGETLTQLNAYTFDDYVKYLPNVSFKSNGPGQNNIYMRGLSAGGSAGSQADGINGLFPNVAVYLDDQSGQLPSRNLDVYAADLERIEILEGPQGTLFGAGAEAGVVRYITNKPQLDATEGNVTAGYSATAHGADNSNVTAVINLPLIADTLAVRAVVYNDARGGYIDNMPGTFTRQSSDLGIHYAYFAGAVPPGSPVANNYALAQNDFNPVTYQGLRVSALYKINDDWNALITQSYQTMDSQGVFYQTPNSADGAPLQPLQVNVFSPSYDNDRFENTAWTLNGKLGDLKAVYTGGYLVRNIDQRNDYTNYARGKYADYYQCYGANNNPTGGGSTCFSPISSWHEQERNTHQSHEMRLSTPDDWRFRGLVGAFWEKERFEDQTDWMYKTVPACTTVGQIGCITDVGVAPEKNGVFPTSNNPATRNDNTSYFEDVTRGYRQYAFFTSMDFDIIPTVLTITGGTRYYDFKNFMQGTSASSFGCYDAGPAPCDNATHDTLYVFNLNAANNGAGLVSNYSGFRSRGNISWHVTPYTMLYYTYSQGFRPGAFNRQQGPGACYIPDASGINRYCILSGYAPDTLINNEMGWKAEFFDHRLQVNGAVYQEVWNNAQVNSFDPGTATVPGFGDTAFASNGQDYRIRGMELSIKARVMEGLLVTAAASYNHSKQTNSPVLLANNPALLANPDSAAEFGKPIMGIINPFGPVGTPTANSPLLQANLRARYEWSFKHYQLFAQAGGMYTSSSFTQSGSNQSLAEAEAINTTLLRFKNPAYALFDAAAGISKGSWNVQFFGQNLADRNASLFTSTAQFIVAETPTRPRVLGVQFGYKF